MYTTCRNSSSLHCYYYYSLVGITLIAFDYVNQISVALDTFSKSHKFLMVGDFNTEVRYDILEDFLFERYVKNLVKPATYF